MPKTYADRVWMTTGTSGTGTITLGTAKNGYMTFAEAGVADATAVTYVLIDGDNFEIGTGTYTSSGTTMSRDTVHASKIGGTAGTSKINLSGSAEVFLSHKASEVAFLDRAQAFTAAQQFTTIELGAASDTTLSRTAAGVVAVEGINILLAGKTGTISKGFAVTPHNLGTLSTGTTTLDPANGNYQYYTNNGAHTIAAPSSDCAIDILVTNGASAGSITFSGFTVGSATGSTYATTNTNKYILSVRRINGTSTYSWYALQ